MPPMSGQVSPDAVHVPLTQQPLPQPLPAQQGWPGAPHAAHTSPSHA
jgi:hypothetical protein